MANTEPIRVIPEDAEPMDSRRYSRTPLSGRSLQIQEVSQPKTAVGRAVRRVADVVRGGKKVVAEVIGRYTLIKPLWNARILINEDATWSDVRFWDQLRYGYLPGYELGSLYCKPIAQTLTAYILGDGISAELAAHAVMPDEATMNGGISEAAKKKSADPTKNIEYTNAALRRMMESRQSFFQRLIYDNLGLGEQFVIVNPDCTFSVASPETVIVEHSPADYRIPVKYTITTKLIGAIVKDIYTAKDRTLIIEYFDKSKEPLEQKFANLIGRIPIVHFTNEKAVNEVHGHSIFEPLLPFFKKYDDLIVKAIDGVELLGNPIPVFENLEDPDATIQRMSTTETYQDWQGNTQTRNVVRMDRDAVIFLGKGGKAQLLGPAIGFTTDSIGMLKALALLMMHHTRLPEYLLGGAISSSKASVSEQFPPFKQYIQSRRLQLEGDGSDSQLDIDARGGLSELIDLYLRQLKVLNPSIIVGPVTIKWPPIGKGDDLANFQWAQFLSEQEYISPEDTVALSGRFDDPDATVARAQGGTTYRPDFANLDQLIDRELLNTAQDEVEATMSDESNSTDTPDITDERYKYAPGAAFNDRYSLTGPADFFPPY